MRIRQHPEKIATGLVLASIGLLTGVFFGNAQAWVVSEDTLREQATIHAKTKLASLVSKEDMDYISIDVLQVPVASCDFPEAKTANDVKISAESVLGEFYSERAVVRLRMETPGGRAREIGVPIKITVRKPVWVVKNVIDAHSPIRLSDLALETRNVSHAYGDSVGRERDLSKYVARVNLRPGEVLDARKMTIPPDVTCNSEVRILMTNGNGMTVSIPGVALGSGRVGDVIRVRQTLNQRKYYQAKIIDRNRVLIEI
ncbi:MAG TPA: flagellar basal body P-ring formation chaperone FlgA [Coleofasciculaceae cyanobacterium]|jgi:flagella basal body P-ring formation protein FlgA